MKAYLILEDGTVFTGTSIGAEREVISEIGAWQDKTVQRRSIRCQRKD